jgi:hypothetical protein
MGLLQLIYFLYSERTEAHTRVNISPENDTVKTNCPGKRSYLRQTSFRVLSQMRGLLTRRILYE